MSFTKLCNDIFNQAIRDYHVTDNIDTPICNPFDEGTIENGNDREPLVSKMLDRHRAMAF